LIVLDKATAMAVHCSDDAQELDGLLSAIRECRVCYERPVYGQPMMHLPRPVLQVSESARICIAGQAPGTRVHRSGRPFDDRSGTRLRDWLVISETSFYDPAKVAIVPMGFCFPGLRADGSDLPPRRECAEIWRRRLFSRLPSIKLLVLVGGHAQKWHLGEEASQSVDATVRRWRDIVRRSETPRVVPLPHPSWRNTHWLKRNPWFEGDLLPLLRAEVRRHLL
jgi:uracil-DNA glycosylase